MKKLNWYTLLFCVSCFVLNTEAQDGCIANTSKYTEKGLKERISIFDPQGKDLLKVFPSKLIQYGFEDKVQLKNGTHIIYTMGGCAHFAFSFTFRGKGIKMVDRAEKLNRAEALLQNITLKSNEHKDMILTALLAAKQKKVIESSKGIFELPCGDAKCTLSDRGNKEVILSYDFAL